MITKSYLLGMLHDATERKNTYRIATKNFNFAKVIREGIIKLNSKVWIYKEGKNRNLWIVEFSKSLLKEVNVKSKQNKIDYIRGYFDAEGGISQNYLIELGVSCGVTHNPSKKVDPNYWRFFIRSKSYKYFAKIISSDHPEKIKLLEMKI